MCPHKMIYKKLDFISDFGVLVDTVLYSKEIWTT